MKKTKETIKKFKLGIVDWKVEYKDYHPDNRFGGCDYSGAKIRIYDKTYKTSVTEQQKTVTFYHELIHAFLMTLNYQELNNDEQFVERMAVMFAQFEATKK